MVEVDIVLPVRNGEQYLPIALESVTTQSFRAWRLIVIDDGSTDRTPEILQSYSDRYGDQILVIRTTGLGISAALNLGLAASQAPLIARMDADDIMLPDRLAIQVTYMHSRPDILLSGADFVQFGKHFGYCKVPKSRFSQCLILFSPFCHPATIFRRKVIEAGIVYDTSMDTAEDYWFFYNVSKIGRLANIPVPVLFYRRHNKQLSEAKMAGSHRRAAMVVDRVCDDKGVSRAFFPRALFLAANVCLVPFSNLRDALRSYRWWWRWRTLGAQEARAVPQAG